MMPKDLGELLRAFNDHGVNYMLVGGQAFGVHVRGSSARFPLVVVIAFLIARLLLSMLSFSGQFGSQMAENNSLLRTTLGIPRIGR